jgi:amino-acid N-acetyltransferase
MHETPLIRARPPRSVAVAFLEAEGLPVSDLTDAHLEHFFYSGNDGCPTALVGLEIHGKDALLRSLVVDANRRTQGLGSALVVHAEHHASSRNVSAIYLLTTTAEKFFERLGYLRIDRENAPQSIQATREFAALCPTSSALMAKRLSNKGES